ncbi:MAG TPA: hypothetical protein VIL49_11920, partial [Capillimicrobium sp.]
TDRVALRPRLRSLPPRPLPEILDARAHRRGTAVIVTWATARPARDVVFVVTALRRGPETPAVVLGRARTRFRAVLRPRPQARRVALVAATPEGEAKQVRIPIA